VRTRSPNVLPFFLPVIGLVALRSPASAVTIKLMESLPRVNVSTGGGAGFGIYSRLLCHLTAPVVSPTVYST
jgi:hypothetical protein